MGHRLTSLTWEKISEAFSGTSRRKRLKGPRVLLARIWLSRFHPAKRRAWCPLLLRPPRRRLRCPTGSLKARNGRGGTADICNATVSLPLPEALTKADSGRVDALLLRHARPCAGHPRLFL